MARQPNQRGLSNGDLSAIQSGIVRYQGQRETRVAQQGAMRWHTLNIPFKRDTNGGGIAGAVILCKFAVVFVDPPVLHTSVAVADGIEWDPTTDALPTVQAAVVNWKRMKKHWLFVGAHECIRAGGLPRSTGVQPGMVNVALTFGGMAMATPVKGGQDTENTNPYYDTH
jgi:hypothetical protein